MHNRLMRILCTVYKWGSWSWNVVAVWSVTRIVYSFKLFNRGLDIVFRYKCTADTIRTSLNMEMKNMEWKHKGKADRHRQDGLLWATAQIHVTRFTKNELDASLRESANPFSTCNKVRYSNLYSSNSLVSPSLSVHPDKLPNDRRALLSFLMASV